MMYKIIYVEDVLLNKKIRAVKELPGIYLPYYDNTKIPTETANTFKSYIYLVQNSEYEKNYDKLSDLLKGQFIVVGGITKEELDKNISELSGKFISDVETGSTIRLSEGDFKNIHGVVQNIDQNEAEVKIQGLEDFINIKVPVSHISLEVEDREQNDHKISAIYFYPENKAIVIDGDHALYRVMISKTFNKIYQTKDDTYIGGGYGFYFTLLRLKEMFPEYEIHIGFSNVDQEYEKPFGKHFYKNYKRNKEWSIQLATALGYSVYIFNKSQINIVASIAEALRQEKYNHVLIYGATTKYFQLVDNVIEILYPKNKSRSYTKHFTKEKLLKRYNIDSIDKINWMLSILDKSNTNITNINSFWRQRGSSKKINKELYCDAANQNTTLGGFKRQLRQDTRLTEFMKSGGTFDQNIKEYQIRTQMLKRYWGDLGAFANQYNGEKVRKLMEEFSFYRELEMFDKNVAILQGLITV